MSLIGLTLSLKLIIVSFSKKIEEIPNINKNRSNKTNFLNVFFKFIILNVKYLHS